MADLQSSQRLVILAEMSLYLSLKLICLGIILFLEGHAHIIHPLGSLSPRAESLYSPEVGMLASLIGLAGP